MTTKLFDLEGKTAINHHRRQWRHLAWHRPRG
jgi:hypothetical protein